MSATQVPNFFSTSKLADGFAEIEKRVLCVIDIYIHPDDAVSFVETMSNGGVSLEEIVEGAKDGVLCQIWSAAVRTDPAVPRTRIKLVSDQSSGAEGIKVRGPITVWI